MGNIFKGFVDYPPTISFFLSIYGLIPCSNFIIELLCLCLISLIYECFLSFGHMHDFFYVRNLTSRKTYFVDLDERVKL